MLKHGQNQISEITKLLLVVVAVFTFVVFAANAGSLAPTASPASTMRTLAEIYNPIASTSYDSSGISADANGSLLQIMRYVSSNLSWASSSDNVYLMSSGKVGLGTTTPLTKLEIQGTASASNLLSSGILQIAGNASTSYSRFGTATTGHGLSAASDLLLSAQLEVDGQTWLDSNASVSGNLEITNWASASKTFGSGLVDCSTAATSKLLYTFSTGKFSCGTDQGVTGSVSANFDPATNNTYDLGDPNYRWRRIYTENIQLATTGGALDTPLEVGGSASISGQLFLGNKTGNIGGRLILSDDGQYTNDTRATLTIANTGPTSKSGRLAFVAGSINQWELGNDYFQNGSATFYVYDSVASRSRLLINSSGFIGVDTIYPSTKLEVQGTASASFGLFSGGLQIAGNSSTSYSRFGTATTGHSLSAASDLLLSTQLEVDGQTWLDSNASVSGNIEITNWASASKTFGSGLVDCSTAATSKLLYTFSTGKFSCGTDQNGGGSGIETEEGGTQNLSAATILNFDPGKFTLTASGSTESVVNFDWGTGGPASRSANDTISGAWSFTGSPAVTGGRLNLTSAAKLTIGATNANQPLEIVGTASATYGLFTGTLQIGDSASTSYSRFGTATTGHSLSAASDLLISGNMEVDGSSSFDGYFKVFGNDSGESVSLWDGGAEFTRPTSPYGYLDFNNTNTNTDDFDFRLANFGSYFGFVASQSAGHNPNLIINQRGLVGIGPVSYQSPTVLLEVLGTASASRGFITNELNVAGIATATTSYSRFGTATTGHSLDAANDLLISADLEVDGIGYFDDDIVIPGATAGTVDHFIGRYGGNSLAFDLSSGTILNSSAHMLLNLDTDSNDTGTLWFAIATDNSTFSAGDNTNPPTGALFTVRDTGRSGFGITTPTTRLEILGTASSSYLFSSGAIQIAGNSSTSYSRFGTATTGHSLSAASDLLLSTQLEVDGQTWLDSNASVSGNIEITNWASASKTFGSGLVDCSTAATSKLLYTFSTGKFSCGTDQGVTGSVSANFDPAGKNSYDLGDPNNSWRTLYAIGAALGPTVNNFDLNDNDSILEISGNASVSGDYFTRGRIINGKWKVYDEGFWGACGLSVGGTDLSADTDITTCRIGFDVTDAEGVLTGTGSIPDATQPFFRIESDGVFDASGGNAYIYWGTITDVAYSIGASYSPSFEMSVRASRAASGFGNEFGFTDRTIDDTLDIRPNNAVVFKIDTDNVWEAMVRSGGTITKGASLSGVTIDGVNFHRFRADIDATTSPNSVRFYVDDVLQATVSNANAVPSVNMTMSAASYDATQQSSGFGWLDIKHIQVWTDDPDTPTLATDGTRIIEKEKPLDLTTTANISQNYPTDNSGLFDEGDIVTLSGQGVAGNVVQSSHSYDMNIVGVVTKQSGVSLGVSNKSTVPVAVNGRAAVKISTNNGSIKRGDFITTSDIPGVGIKATESGRVVGVALEDFDGTELKTAAERYLENTIRNNDLRGKQRLILVRISPEWYDASLANSDVTGMATLSDAIASSSQGVLGGRGIEALAAGLNGVAKKTYGITIGRGLLKVSRIAANIIEADHSKVKDLEVTNGISLYDQNDKSPYCVTINNGSVQTAPGLCATPIPPLEITEKESLIVPNTPTPTTIVTPEATAEPAPKITPDVVVLPTEITLTPEPTIVVASASATPVPEVPPLINPSFSPLPSSGFEESVISPGATPTPATTSIPAEEGKAKEKTDKKESELSAQVSGGLSDYGSTLAEIIAEVVKHLAAWLTRDLARMFR